MISLKKEHQSYKLYKQSRAAWRKNLPQNWHEKRLKFVVQVIAGNGFPHEYQGLEEGKYPFYKVSDINKEGVTISHSNNFVTESMVREQNWKIVPKGSILTGKIGEALKMNHRKINEFDCLVDNNMIGLRPGKDISIKYFYYLSKVIDMEWFTHPGAVPSVDMTELKECWLPIPDQKAQSFIATHLDKQCALIDHIIEGKQKQIEILNEQRATIIRQAVTKGSDGEEKVKESGVEWIKKIPVDWQMMPLKRLGRFVGGGTPDTDNLAYWNGNLPWISPKDMKSDFILATEDSLSVEGVKAANLENVPAGSFVMVVRSGILRHTLPVAVNSIDVWLNQDMKALILSKNIIPEYLMRLFNGLNSDILSLTKKIGATVESIEMNFLMNLHLPIPPIEKQKVILNRISSQLKNTDKILVAIEDSILFLKEYKASLISHAVTGKVKVQ